MNYLATPVPVLDSAPVGLQHTKHKKRSRCAPFKTDADRIACYHKIVIALEGHSVDEVEKEFGLHKSTICWRARQYFKLIGDEAAQTSFRRLRMKQCSKSPGRPRRPCAPDTNVEIL